MERWIKASALFDSLGMATSWLCLLHCLGLPLTLLILPALGAHLCHDDKTHLLLAGWVFVFAVLSMLPEKNRRKDETVIYLMVTGLCIVLTATFGTTFGLSESIEIPLITAGNLLVIAAHHLNRSQRCCQPQKEQHHGSLNGPPNITEIHRVVP